jgi:transaldolase
MMNPIHDLHKLGQSIWYDNIQRSLLTGGGMAQMVADGDIRGVTSNPSIFHNAIAKSSEYDDALVPLAKAGRSALEIYEALAIADIQSATDIFRGLYDETGGADGYVSLEVSPYLAHNTRGTCEEARRLWGAVSRPNLMIKIPATKAGLPAITETIAAGINVNVTLIFSQARYVEVMDAYLAGLERRMEAGKPVDRIASVASFFVSRIDSKVDKALDAIVAAGGRNSELAGSLRGRMAVANAKKAYQKHLEIFAKPRFQRLKAAGARTQRALWASTSTKNPAYRDVMYVEELIGPNTVNTVPPNTLEAFRDHGEARLTLASGLAEAGQAFEALRAVGISFSDVTQELEDEGVKAFADSFTALLDAVETRREAVG